MDVSQWEEDDNTTLLPRPHSLALSLHTQTHTNKHTHPTQEAERSYALHKARRVADDRRRLLALVASASASNKEGDGYVDRYVLIYM